MPTQPSVTPPKGRNPLLVIRRARAAWGRLSPFFQTSRLKMSLLVLSSVVAGLAEAGLLAVVGAIAGALSQDQSEVAAQVGPVAVSAEISTMFGIGIALAVARGALQVLIAYLPANMSAQAMADLRRRLFDAFVRAAWPVKAAERDGQFQSLMNAHITSASQAIITMGTGISVALVFITMLFSAFVLSWPAAAILSVVSLGLFVVLRPLARRLRKHSSALSAENIEYSKGVQEIVLMAEETEVFGASASYRESFHRLVDGVRLPMMRTRFLAAAVPALYQSVALLLLVVALGAVSLVGLDRIATLGAVVLILIRALTYGQQMQAAVTSLDERIPFMHRLGDALDTYITHPQQNGEKSLPVVERIGMRDVRFSYPTGDQVLSGITFTVRAGEAVGIVGPSGAGKSSIVQLLLRLRDPAGGMVHVNDEDARAFRREDWQRRVAYVPQSPQLVWGTVRDNIRFYRTDLTEEQIERAARRAQIHDEVMSWPDGYDTVVGQRASAVSGGQRQRICLARALAAEPDVLILDEPTSALDVKSESLVHASLQHLKGDITIFLVAHRLPTLSFCDRVMVVVGGRIEGFDDPAQLLSDNGFYREINEITRRQSAN